jgi:ATP-dependent Clp protease ATP-binding subunit ClpC
MNNFTPRAQQVLALARKEADRFNHNYVGTEHILLGLIKLGQGVAVSVLQNMGLDLDTVRIEVEKQVGSGPENKLRETSPTLRGSRRFCRFRTKRLSNLIILM